MTIRFISKNYKLEFTTNNLVTHAEFSKEVRFEQAVYQKLARDNIEPEITFTGGVSRNLGMVRALEEKLGMKLNVSPDSHFVGALGASIFALERAAKGVSSVEQTRQSELETRN